MEKILTLRNEHGYMALMGRVLQTGNYRKERTGTGAYSIFGEQLKFDLDSFNLPLLTTKKVFTKSVILELLWFLRGETNIKTLGCGIWDQWADAEGELGPIYGKQWRSWTNINEVVGTDHENGVDLTYGTIDQIDNVMESLRKDPFSRRHIVTAWNPAELPDMALSPCHCLFQFFVRVQDGIEYLDCQLYQRSADLFIGVPFNIASYSILTMMMAKALHMRPGVFTHTFGDVHIYENHLQQCFQQIEYYKTKGIKPFPKLKLSGERENLEDYVLEDFEVIGYEHGPHIPAPVAK